MTEKDPDNQPIVLDLRNGIPGLLDDAGLDEYYLGSFDDTSAHWDEIDLEAVFELPPVLRPVRLPEEAELATQARQSKLLADLRALADQVRETTVQAPAVDPLLLELAEASMLVEVDADDVVPGDDVEWPDRLADGADADVLDAWEATFAEVLDTTLAAADDSGASVDHDLDLEGHGPSLVMRLFLSRAEGVLLSDLVGVLKFAATADLPAEDADLQWREWADAHGDPLRLLLSQLERLGAVNVTDDVARLEPLGVWAVRLKLERDDLSVPLIPPPDKMTVGDLVLVRMHGTDDDLKAELASWTARRGEVQAARDLLAFAAEKGAAARTVVIAITAELGEAAEPAWREALDRVQLRCYAKIQIANLAGLGQNGMEVPAELQHDLADIAWLIADLYGPFTRLDLGQEAFPSGFAEFSRFTEPGTAEETFEFMARMDHPDAQAVLKMIGKHAKDKAIAKAARRAAYKASTRRATRR